MADVTIGQLPLKTSASSTDVLPISDGTTTSRISVSNLLNSGVPIGTIVMWSNRGGAGIPSGWQICDGTNGTPDLRNRFIVGSGSSYAIGATGGASTASGNTDSTTLTINQIPAHSHSGVIVSGSSGNCNGAQNTTRISSLASGSTVASGGGQGHSHTISSLSIIPPYYALAYIQKVS